MEEIKAKYHELSQHPNIVEKGLDFLKVPGRGGITGRYMGRGNYNKNLHSCAKITEISKLSFSFNEPPTIQCVIINKSDEILESWSKAAQIYIL